ncbi:MAG: phosphoglycerate kinase [bacterium]
MKLPLLTSVAVSHARVLVRVGFDVPTDGRGRVLDAFRIKRGLHTLRWLRRHRARTILLGHRGQPHGVFRRALSLRPVARTLSQLLGTEVAFLSRQAKELVPFSRKMRDGDIALLENLRFDIREEQNNTVFAAELARIGDLFVNDDFSTSHRPHTSLVALPRLLPHVAGSTLVEEVAMLERLLRAEQHPFFVVLGGAKVHDKLGVVRNLLRRVDTIIVGGASASTLLHAKGYAVGRSLVDTKADRRELGTLVRSKKIFLPTDLMVAASPHARNVRAVSIAHITPSMAAFDIGPETTTRYMRLLATARTVFWAGSLGYIERRRFCRSTQKLASCISRRHTFAVAGGGDTIRAFDALGLSNRFSYLSTGGGATLTFLAGLPLPGIEALRT